MTFSTDRYRQPSIVLIPIIYESCRTCTGESVRSCKGLERKTFSRFRNKSKNTRRNPFGMQTHAFSQNEIKHVRSVRFTTVSYSTRLSPLNLRKHDKAF